MNKNNDERLKNSFSLTAALSVSAFLLFFCISNIENKSEKLSAFAENHILFYGAALVVFAAALLILRFALKHAPAAVSRILDKPLPEAIQIELAVGFTFLGIVGLVCQFIISKTDPLTYDALIFHESIAVIPFLILVAVSGLWLKKITRTSRIYTCLLYLFYIAAIVMTFFSLLYIDIFQSDIYHTSAYIQSIINVCQGVPYDIYTTGIYGHYGLLYAPFVHLLGGTGTSITLLIAFFGALTTVICAYIIDNIIKNNYLRILTIFSSILTVAAMRQTAYYQLQPHRILFPMLIVALIVFFKKHNFRMTGLKTLLIGYAVCTLAIIWNTETGIFCAAAFSVSTIIDHWQNHFWYEKSSLYLYLKCMFSCLVSMLAALLTVNIYNIFCGGKPIFRAFFFPMFEKDYMIDWLGHFIVDDMQMGNYPWVCVVILLSSMLLFALSHTYFFGNKNPDPIAPVIGCLSMVGLLGFSYYANRAAFYNLDICCQICCIGTGFFCDRYSGSIRLLKTERLSFTGTIRASYSIIAYFILCSMAVHIYLFFPLTGQKADDKVFDYASLQAKASTLAAAVPMNTYAYGTGIDFLYQELGWHNQQYYRDYSDLYVGGDIVEQKILEDIKTQNQIALLNVGELYDTILDENPDMSTESAIQIGSFPCYLLSRNVDRTYTADTLSFNELAENTNNGILIHTGGVQYGPDCELSAGKYTITIKGDNLDNADYDAYAGDKLPLTELSRSESEIVYSLSLTQRHAGFEFRTFNNSSEDIVVNSISVKK